jgi:uncharacterized membrane protein YgcG
MNTRNRSRLSSIALPLALLAIGIVAPTANASASNGGAAAPSANSGTQAAASASRNARAATGSHRAVPVITGAVCYRIGKTHCNKNPRSVQITGELVIHGRHLSHSLTVYFPQLPVGTAARVQPLGARLRPTPHGFAVTVPTGVRSGRIYLKARSGAKSRKYGPVTILAAPPQPVVATPVGVTAFDGPGMWIWYLNKSDGGDLGAIAAAAKLAGITTLFIKSSDGPSDFWAQFTPTLVQSLHALGLSVCGWQYVYGADPAGEAAMGAEAVADGADCLVIDAESEYEGNYYGAQTYLQDLRAAIGPTYPVGLSSFPYVDLHESEPYSVWFGPDGAQFDVPQIYWHAIGTTPDAAYARTYVDNRIYGRPIVPVGQTYGNVPPAQMTRFRQLAAAYGATGFSWWSWQATTTAGWGALDTPLTPGTAITLPTTWPTLGSGSRGDQVVWMQEHLAAAEPSTPTTGTFNATTEANLKAFQAAHGLPQSGVTDAATWPALLALTPVTVVYPPPPPSGTTGPTGTTGGSGSTGATGSSGGSGTSGSSGSSGSSGGTGA